MARASETYWYLLPQVFDERGPLPGRTSEPVKSSNSKERGVASHHQELITFIECEAKNQGQPSRDLVSARLALAAHLQEVD